LRAGVHTGEVELRAGGDVTGVAVHVASRIAAVADAGDVIVSRTVSELVRGAGFDAADLGERSLRGVDGVWTLFKLDDAGSARWPQQ
jgi:class 3 adenylate cyclase